MNPKRFTFLALGGAALFSAALALAPASSFACNGENGAACGCDKGAAAEHAGHPEGAGGCSEHAAKVGDPKQGTEQAACSCGSGHGACGCGKAGDAAGGCGCGGSKGSCGEGKPETAAPPGAKQEAVIDPITGELGAPRDDQAVDAAPAAARGAAPREVAQADGSVSAAFPKDRTSHAVATVDPSGKPAMGCSEDAK